MQEGGAAALGLSNVGGVFVVLIGGLTMACVIAFFETLWNKREIRKAAILVRLTIELIFSFLQLKIMFDL